ncbi:hypothetical protein VTI28DRAFT_533 [Corynascus sepedonium]
MLLTLDHTVARALELGVRVGSSPGGLLLKVGMECCSFSVFSVLKARVGWSGGLQEKGRDKAGGNPSIDSFFI